MAKRGPGNDKRGLGKFFGRALPFRRRVQILTLLICNADLRAFARGGVSRSPLKRVCVPGLNCYSCPGAIASCPLGALQNGLAGSGFPLYIVGLLLLFGVTLGRLVCGFLCPFGLIQELLYRIPSPKLRKNALTRRLTLLKYLFLVILVAGIPGIALVYGYGIPLFCKFICPAGTLEAGIPLTLANSALREGIGGLFYWKLALLTILILLAVPVFRVFCRFLCPLGALYGLFNRYALWGIRRDRTACTHCGACAELCRMDTRIANDRECIRCGNCVRACPVRALSNAVPGWTLRSSGAKESL
ncbi:MAG: 4Fe-4S binding protein [Treponema sp.]|nr:4Fe-4S binding protein [Treponema sp.]